MKEIYPRIYLPAFYPSIEKYLRHAFFWKPLLWMHGAFLPPIFLNIISLILYLSSKDTKNTILLPTSSTDLFSALVLSGRVWAFQPLPPLLPLLLLLLLLAMIMMSYAQPNFSQLTMMKLPSDTLCWWESTYLLGYQIVKNLVGFRAVVLKVNH